MRFSDFRFLDTMRQAGGPISAAHDGEVRDAYDLFGTVIRLQFSNAAQDALVSGIDLVEQRVTLLLSGSPEPLLDSWAALDWMNGAECPESSAPR